MRHILLLHVVLFGLMSILSMKTASAQINRNLGISSGWTDKLDSKKEKAKSITNQPINVKPIQILRNSYGWTEETRYFEDICLDSLWYVGVGNPVSAREASKMEKVYRLSMKLNNGKYIHVECLSRGVQLTDEKFCSRLFPLENYDYDMVDSAWVASEKCITQVYQYPSSDNNRKAIEISCDSEGNIAHSASIEFTAGCQAIIVYYNASGNIINLTNSKNYKDGTIVLVELDSDGGYTYTVTDIGGWPIKKFQ